MKKLQEFAWLVARAISGILAMMLTFRGLYSAWAVDFRFSTLLTLSYCIAPGISVFVFLFARRFQVEIFLQSLIALIYTGCFIALNWRTCSAYGYCESIGATTLMTLQHASVLWAIGVVCFTLIAHLLDAKRKPTSAPALPSA